jgi:SET family sugar efflux transporter-like MFS transporter
VRAYYSAKAPGRADFMVSLMRTIFSASWVVVPPLAGIVAATFEIFDVYLATSLAYLANGALFLLMMRDGQTRIPPPPKAVKHARGGQRLNEGVLMGLLAIVVVSVAMRLVALSMPLLIVGELNGTTADVGLYAGAAALVEIPFMLMWGYLVGRYLTKEAAIVISSVLLGIYILLAARADSVWDILLLQLLNGLAASALLSITISYIQDAVKGRIGLSSSFMDVVAILATLIGAAIFGTISAGGDYRSALLFAAALAVAAALVMVLGNWRRLLLRLVPEPSSGAQSG